MATSQQSDRAVGNPQRAGGQACEEGVPCGALRGGGDSGQRGSATGVTASLCCWNRPLRGARNEDSSVNVTDL